MTIPFVCVLIACLLIVLTRIPVGRAMKEQAGRYDNNNPRDQQAQLTGWGKRALAAHQNTIEAFAPFAAAVVVSFLAKAPMLGCAILSLIFVAARIAYPLCYIADKASARSMVWGVGYLATIGLFVLAFFG